MDFFDGWAATIGAASCRFLSRDHGGVYEVLCSDGYSSAGWKVFITVLVLIGVGLSGWRLLRPN